MDENKSLFIPVITYLPLDRHLPRTVVEIEVEES
jgi:hypothetical protein